MEEEHREYVQYVQERYFKTGPYTHLCVDMQEADGVLRVKWVFTFQDLGSTHILSRDPAVVRVDSNTGTIMVDDTSYRNVECAERVIFEGHYADYVRELYAFEGIQSFLN